MSDLVDSITLIQGNTLFFVVAAVVTSAGLLLLPGWVAWSLGVFVSFAGAFCLYWFPVWRGGVDPSEYGGWSFIVIPEWTLFGIFGATCTMAAFKLWKRIRPSDSQ